jgi:hypothetical protein
MATFFPAGHPGNLLNVRVARDFPLKQTHVRAARRDNGVRRL